MNKVNELMCHKENMRRKVYTMKIGDVIWFDIDKRPTIKNYTSEIGMLLTRKYITRSVREERRIYVTRIS